MLNSKLIVGLTLMTLLVLPACGQKGTLTLPKESAAQNRATLPQILNPAGPASLPASAPR